MCNRRDRSDGLLQAFRPVGAHPCRAGRSRRLERVADGVADVDGIVRSLDDIVLHNDIAQAIGIHNASWFSHAGVGGTAPSGMVAQAVAAILSGQATTVLAYRSLNGRSGKRSGLRWSGTEGQTVGGEKDGRYDEYFVPYGLTAPGHYYSLLARRHMIQYGTTSASTV